MKRNIKALALVLALILILCSCGSSAAAFSEGIDENGDMIGVDTADYVTIGDLDNIVLKEADIQATIELFTDYYLPDEKKIYDRAVVETDSVNIDYIGSIDGEAFEGGNTNGYGTVVDIQHTSYIDGFLPQIVGHTPGEIFDINVTFPEDYDNEDLAGKDAVFVTTLNYIVEYTPAEFNDEYVQKNANALYQYLRAYVSTAEEFVSLLRSTSIQNYVLSQCKFKEDAEIPEDIQKCVNKKVLLSMEEYAENTQGVELSTYLKSAYNVNSEEEFYETYAEDLKTEAQSVIIMQALAEHYGLETTEDDLKSYFDDDSEETIDYKQAVKIYGVPYLKQYFRSNSVWQYIMTIAKFE